MASPENIRQLLSDCKPLYMRPDITRNQLIELFQQFPNLKLYTITNENEEISLQISGNIPIYYNRETVNSPTHTSRKTHMHCLWCHTLRNWSATPTSAADKKD